MMAGETHDQTLSTARYGTQKSDHSIAEDLKQLQMQFQDAFRRYRDIIGRTVCDDHDRRITNIQILLINQEIKEINGKQRTLVRQWRRTKEARRILIKLSRRKRLESDINERFNFHYSARFRRHWEMALERMQVIDKDETLRLKSLALLDILPKALDKELRQIEKDEPPAPCRTDIMKALGLDKVTQNGKKRGASRRGGGSAGGSGEEGRQFKAPRCSKRIRGVSPSMEADEEEEGRLSTPGHNFVVNVESVEGEGSEGRSPSQVEKVTEESGSAPTSPSSQQPCRTLDGPESEQRRTKSLDGGERRHFCCAYCHSIRRISASMYRTDGVLWCGRCRRLSGSTSALESNADKPTMNGKMLNDFEARSLAFTTLSSSSTDSTTALS